MNRADLEEQTIGVKRLHQGKMIAVDQVEVVLPNGRPSSRDVVRHPGAVAVLAETDDKHVFCVEQYRIATGQILLEIPAGKLDPNEDPLDCAKRELREETGYQASHWEKIAAVYTSPGFADERITIFYASGLTRGEQQLDDDEFLHVSQRSLAEVQELVGSGQVSDAKSLIAFQWWLGRANGAIKR